MMKMESFQEQPMSMEEMAEIAAKEARKEFEESGLDLSKWDEIIGRTMRRLGHGGQNDNPPLRERIGELMSEMSERVVRTKVSDKKQADHWMEKYRGDNY